MKKLLFITALLFSLQSNAQKDTIPCTIQYSDSTDNVLKTVNGYSVNRLKPLKANYFNLVNERNVIYLDDQKKRLKKNIFILSVTYSGVKLQ